MSTTAAYFLTLLLSETALYQVYDHHSRHSDHSKSSLESFVIAALPGGKVSSYKHKHLALVWRKIYGEIFYFETWKFNIQNVWTIFNNLFLTCWWSWPRTRKEQSLLKFLKLLQFYFLNKATETLQAKYKITVIKKPQRRHSTAILFHSKVFHRTNHQLEYLHTCHYKQLTIVISFFIFAIDRRNNYETQNRIDDDQTNRNTDKASSKVWRWQSSRRQRADYITIK